MSLIMTAAVVPFFVMMVAVGACGYQFASEICFHCFVCISLCTGAQFHACFRESRLCPAADAAADQHIHVLSGQKSGKGAVSASIGPDHFTGYNFVILHFVNLKLLCPSEMLKDISIVISYCYFHFSSSSFFYFCALLFYHNVPACTSLSRKPWKFHLQK